MRGRESTVEGLKSKYSIDRGKKLGFVGVLLANQRFCDQVALQATVLSYSLDG